MWIIIILIIIAIYVFSLIKKYLSQITLTEEFIEIIHLLENTNTSLFITGRAGTGKSTLLKYFTQHTRKKYVVLAPTGVAALNVRGQTIHSFFGFPKGIIKKQNIRPDFRRVKLFENIQMVIIDEVSMVRADLMDGIDQALRINRNKPDIPFGGVQMVFIGDLFQLPPVVPNDLLDYFKNYYKSQFFFDAKVFEQFTYKCKELTKIFRQKNEKFINLLNKIRVNQAEFDDFVLLNSRCVENTSINENKGAIFLITTNDNAKQINNDMLERLPHPEVTYRAILEVNLAKDYEAKKDMDDNDSNNSKFPTEVNLKLKIGAQVMMIKNDPGKRWVNGTIGIIQSLSNDYIVVKIGKNIYRVKREKWEEIEYRYNNYTHKIEEKPIGVFIQFPVKLAWAITIHKSQGKTFDNIIIDIGSGAFAHGQTYVALSRCKSLEGIILKRQIEPKDVIVDQRVVDFYKTFLR